MSELLYADTANVAEAVQHVVDTTSYDDDSVSISVHDSEAVMSGITYSEVKERNLGGHLGGQVCRFEYDGTQLAVGFHQSQVEGALTLRPAGHDAIPPVDQATSVKDLAPAVGRVLTRLEDEFEITSYDFAEVTAASIASGGHFTDFEFEYVVTSTDLL